MAAFRDRSEAGRRLAAALTPFATEAPLVLALPRGGVPVAFEIAQALGTPLDVLLVRKIGAPGHEELALGAIVDGMPPELVVNEHVMSIARPPPGYLDAAKADQLKEIERRRRLYRGDRPPVSVRDRTVVVVDDGIATGATIKAAVRGLRRSGPKRLIVAVPVAPAETIAELRDECDDVVCLATPEPFHAVGLHYEHFGQTSDEEVVALLDAAWARHPSASDAERKSC